MLPTAARLLTLGRDDGSSISSRDDGLSGMHRRARDSRGRPWNVGDRQHAASFSDATAVDLHVWRWPARM